MSQQQMGAVAFMALGVLILAAGMVGAARRRALGRRSGERLTGRVLGGVATVGLSVGFVAEGLSGFVGPAGPWITLNRVAFVCFAVAILGYAATLARPAWRLVLRALE
jgi:hypothetical protein